MYLPPACADQLHQKHLFLVRLFNRTSLYPCTLNAKQIMLSDAKYRQQQPLPNRHGCNSHGDRSRTAATRKVRFARLHRTRLNLTTLPIPKSPSLPRLADLATCIPNTCLQPQPPDLSMPLPTPRPDRPPSHCPWPNTAPRSKLHMLHSTRPQLSTDRKRPIKLPHLLRRAARLLEYRLRPQRRPKGINRNLLLGFCRCAKPDGGFGEGAGTMERWMMRLWI